MRDGAYTEGIARFIEEVRRPIRSGNLAHLGPV